MKSIRNEFAPAILATGLILLLSAGAAAAQQLPGQPDAAEGKSLAQRLCVTCHIPEAGAPQLQGSADIPTFSEIAQKEGQSAERIASRIILPSHPMPNIFLSRDEMRDIAAYILRPKSAP